MTDFAPLDTFREAVGPADPERTERMREEFRARIATMPTDDEGRRPFDPPVTPTSTRPTRRRARRPVLALAAVAALLLLAGAGAVLGRSGEHTTNDLHQLAARAEARADQPLGHSEYLHVAGASVENGSRTAREQWTATDGTGQARVASLRLTPAGGAPAPMTVYSTPGSLAFAGMTYAQLRELPTDPEALLDRLRQLGLLAPDARPGTRAEALAQVAALDVTPPAVVAAAIRGLEQLGGQPIGSVPDGNGGVGVGVRGDNGDGTTWIVVLDGESGAALAVHDRLASGATTRDATGQMWTDQTITTNLPAG